MFYYLCRCIPRPEGGGNLTEPAVEAMFRAGLLRQVWNDHASLTSLVVAKYREEKPHECMTELTDRQAALDWLTSVDAGAPVTYRDPVTRFDKRTERVPVEIILLKHDEGM